MSAPELQNTIVNASAAEKAIADLESIMDHLEQALTEETARVRAGKLRDAGPLSEAKIEFARLYALESARIRAAKEAIERWLPDAFERLRKRHDTFQDLLQKNLTVLATAHAVSEGIIRGVSGELARKQAPSTYGANGQAQAPSTKTTQPLALSRCL
jgi:flagellar biosynthesis/type III secretory pathway chaperone